MLLQGLFSVKIKLLHLKKKYLIKCKNRCFDLEICWQVFSSKKLFRHIYIQGVPKKCIHTLNNCKFRVYYNSNKFQHVKEFTNIILLSCYRMFSN